MLYPLSYGRVQAILSFCIAVNAGTVWFFRAMAGDGMPDLVMLRQHLTMVEEHIAKGLKSIERQRAVIDRLAAKGLDLVRAKDVLRFLLEAQELHQQHHDRLRSQLGL